MIHQLLATFDVKTGFYSKPVAVPLDGAGVRAFQDAVNEPGSEFNKHPEDYSIWNIGEYNDNTAETTNKKPQQLAQAVALLQTKI